MVVGVHQFHDGPPLLIGHLLSVSRVGHRLVLIVLQSDVPQLVVGNVLHIQPLQVKASFPLILCPEASVAAEVYLGGHLGHAAEVSATVDTEEEEHVAALGLLVAVGPVQPAVPVLCGAPDIVLYGPVNVVLCIALDDKESGVGHIHCELWRVVVVLGL